ncbi:hypothetical protein IWW43_000566 [Coemansia sp. RSA 1935]|nr:hypothetical protein LPJ58_001608 [Coemansia sp. RSA 1591]KAJ2154284.1 hypothetical protein J3F82_001319 [Coemansia sp. RSA 637]KAJ2432892.1 hypothetical protein IWW46_006523 [Coemansia sp. RSA 2440]KAJ2536771.1 hypothetical protein IWW43_000566 [Coemansia sp. RSA 1935]KAJ2641503.1 hypothetical protein IW137_003063 [Coemansia sp. RSA 1287]
MAHPLVAARIILVAIVDIACLNTDKASASVLATMADKLQQRLDDAKRLYAFNLQHVRVQNKRESAAMLSNYNNLMTLYRRKCEVVDKHTRAAAQIKVNFRAFGSEIRAVAGDRNAKAEEIEYLRALLSE